MVSSPQRRWRLFGGRGDSSPEPEPDRGGDSEQASPASAPGAPPEELGAALDLIGYMLRLLGQVPVLPDEPASADLGRTYDRWARHILTLAPPPPADTPAPRRAWGTLAEFLTEQRHREQAQVAASLTDLRRAVLTMAEAVRGTLAREQTDAQTVQTTIGRLQRAADAGSLEHVRQEVRRATEELLVLATQRDSRQQELATRVAELSQQVQALATELYQARRASETDALTGLLNRAGFDAALRHVLTQHATTGQVVSLALIDLDDLKWVNDQYGHTAGDAALRAVAECLHATCRGTDALARIGGDEFAAILLDAAGVQAERVAERFLHELWSRNLPVEAGVIRVSASVGLAEARRTDGPLSWLDRADKRLYRAKGLGKNRAVGDSSSPEAPSR